MKTKLYQCKGSLRVPGSSTEIPLKLLCIASTNGCRCYKPHKLNRTGYFPCKVPEDGMYTKPTCICMEVGNED